MAQVPKELIEEATSRGIVPGAIITSAWMKSKPHAFVPSYSTWRWEDDEDLVFPVNEDEHHWVYDKKSGDWATVITPAPSKGLQEGDSVECGPAMRAAIIELAQELGMAVYSKTPESGSRYPSLTWSLGELCGLPTNSKWSYLKRHTPEEFIARMRVTACIPKPETIDGHKVEYHAGYIKVGCTKVPNDVVRAIHKKLVE